MRESLRTLRTTEFPWTADTVYLNNASIGPLPERTRRYLDQFNAKRTAPHLLPDRDIFAGLAATREAVARLINAEAGEIALATNTSYGVNVAATSLPIAAGEVVLVSDREFPANMYPWLMLEKRGVVIETVPTTKEGWPDEAHILERLRDPKVRVLAISFVQFSNGFRADLKKLGAAAKANGTYFVVDAIQGIGNSPLDVKETPVDIMSCGGQKWLLSPWGSGFVYVRKELIATIEPAVVSWMAFEGTDDFSNLVDYNPVFRNDARRFEMITLPYQDLLGFATSLELLEEVGLRNVVEVTQSLHQPVLKWADEHGVRVASPRDERHRSAILCVAPPKAAEAFHHVKRARVVCALREGAIRLSPHFYNTVEEMEKVVEVLDDVLHDKL
ncbi:MAG TPA: aminotransferase class V-fold PLP-dependent enzyme [Gemmatimonadales bacterium]|nr:aminotransferase class V-fold PLP-dependent enzyme [Gemmatimonadales bacterium]